MVGKFQVYEVALEMVSALRPSLEALARKDRDVADQLRRASSSVVLNIAEGARRWGKDRLHFYRIAAGSAAEVRAALEVARAWEYLQSNSEVEVLLDRVLAMLWRLTRARG
jgi:four helix bundle protein